MAKRRRRKKLKVLERVEVIGSGGNVYEVEVLENGKARCPCKGFRYRRECRHLLDPNVRDLVLAHAPARRSHAEVAFLAGCLVTALAPYCQRIEVMGSLRRGRRSVKDIDIIFAPGGWPAASIVSLFRTFGRPVHHGEEMGAIVPVEDETQIADIHFQLLPTALDFNRRDGVILGRRKLHAFRVSHILKVKTASILENSISRVDLGAVNQADGIAM